MTDYFFTNLYIFRDIFIFIQSERPSRAVVIQNKVINGQTKSLTVILKELGLAVIEASASGTQKLAYQILDLVIPKMSAWETVWLHPRAPYRRSL